MQGLRVALGKEESKNSGLEGLLNYQSQGRLIKEENEQARTPYEVLNQMKYDLNLTEKDLIFLSATYLNNSNQYGQRAGFNCGFIDMKKYKPENYNQDSFAKYKIVLSEKDKAKLDFEILLYTIKSKELIQDYGISHHQGQNSTIKYIEKKSYTDLVFEFIPNLWGMTRPNGRGFTGSLNAINDHNMLKKLVKTDTMGLPEAIDYILKNEYKDYFSQGML